MRSILSFGAWSLAAAGLLTLPLSVSSEPPPHLSLQPEQATVRIPEFEVAAIRPNRSNELVRSFWFTPDGVYIKGFPLHAILHTAFLGLHEYGEDRILGEPAWVRTERYDIQAKVGEADVGRWKKLSVDQQRSSLQALIGERFNLRYHRESRVSSAYVLSIAKKGLRVRTAKSAADGHGTHMFYPLEPGNMQSHSTYMWQLVEELENQLNCIVLDETGLAGTYDYSLAWTPDDPQHAETAGPSLFTALKEQLGLKLELQKRPVDVVIIDHIERPSPN